MSDCISIKNCQDCVARKCTWGILYGQDGKCVEDLDDLGDSVLGVVGPDSFCSTPDCRDTLVILDRVVDWFYVSGISAIGAIGLGALGVGIFVYLQRRRQFQADVLQDFNVREVPLRDPNNEKVAEVRANQHRNANAAGRADPWMPGIVRYLRNFRRQADDADAFDLQVMNDNYRNMRRVVRNSPRQAQNLFGFLRFRNPNEEEGGPIPDPHPNERFWFYIHVCMWIFIGLWTAVMHFFAPQIQNLQQPFPDLDDNAAPHEEVEDVDVIVLQGDDMAEQGEDQLELQDQAEIIPPNPNVQLRQNLPRIAKQNAINSIRNLAMNQML